MTRAQVISVASASVLLLASVVSAFQAPAADDAAASDEVDIDQATAIIVERTNAFRKEHELQPLETDESLAQAAQGFAEYMADEDVYGHHADGRTPAQRAKAAGYEYCIVRENIAYRSDSRDNTAEGLGEKFTQGWIDSPEHRENMLGEHLQDTGIGLATTDGRTFYAVQMFGRPRSASIAIRIVNESEKVAELEVEGDSGTDSMEIPPRAIVRLRRCMPTQLSVGDSESKLEISESAELAIVASDEGLVLRRSEEQPDQESNRP